MLARKQHTMNAILRAYFDKDFRNAMKLVMPKIRSGDLAKHKVGGIDNLSLAVRFLLNHYEFLAAGVRTGDHDERLLKDTERGTMIAIFEGCQPYIGRVQQARGQKAVYEHQKWLYGRWRYSPPGKVQRFFEWCRGRPFQGKRIDPDA